MKTIGIFPAAGGLGGSTYNHLLQHPAVDASKVTLISRDPSKIPTSYIDRGVRSLQASYESTPAELETVFAGIEVLFLISYPSHVRDYRVKVQLPAIDAAYKAGVKHIFYSSLGFALPEKTESLAEVMQAHLVSEEYLQKLAANDPKFSWTSIREGLYHESFPIYTSFWTLANPVDEILIPHDGTGPGVSWVKRDELGEASASLIIQYASSSSPSEYPWNRRRVILTGPREWTLADTVKVLGDAVGREVRIKQISIDEWVKLPQILSYFGQEKEARTWATAWAAIRAGETNFVSPTLAQILGREPEAFEVTVKQLAKDSRGL